MPTKRTYRFICFISIWLLAIFLLNIFVGDISLDQPELFRQVILQLRLPASLTAFGAGAALGVAGLLMQLLFKNPIAGPSILGFTSGAQLFIVLATLLHIQLSVLTFQSFSVLPALVGTFAVFLVIWGAVRKIKDSVILLLIGYLLGGFCSAISLILQSVLTDESLSYIIRWSFGTFEQHHIPFAISLFLVAVVTSVIAIVQHQQLDQFSLGEELAQTMGLPLQQTRILLILLSAVAVSVVTAFCGPITFIGIIAPHMARMGLQTVQHRLLIPTTFIIGAAVALTCRLIALAPFLSFTLPINAVLALVGLPFIFWIVLQQRQYKQNF